MRDVNVFLFRH